MEKKNQYKWMGLFALGISVLINTPLTIAIVVAFFLMIYSVNIADDDAEEEMINIAMNMSEEEMEEKCEFVFMLISSFVMIIVFTYKFIILL